MKGWECPKCGTCWAPSEPKCKACAPAQIPEPAPDSLKDAIEKFRDQAQGIDECRIRGHDYPLAWHGTIPPNCSRCGKPASPYWKLQG